MVGHGRATRLLDDPNWIGFALPEVVEPRSATDMVFRAARYVTKPKGMKAASAYGVTRIFQISEPQGDGLLIYRRGECLPEILYFTESRWSTWNRRLRQSWKRGKPMVVWLLDKVSGALIGLGVRWGMDKLFFYPHRAGRKLDESSSLSAVTYILGKPE